MMIVYAQSALKSLKHQDTSYVIIPFATIVFFFLNCQLVQAYGASFGIPLPALS